jgi:hypothetical protein
MAANLPSSLQVRICGYADMKQYLQLPVIAPACAGLGAGAMTAYRLAAAPSCRAGAAPYTRLELLFGLGRQRSGEIGRERSGEISEEKWRAFLEMEVTPRFAAGLTVLAAYGQWRSPHRGDPRRLQAAVRPGERVASGWRLVRVLLTKCESGRAGSGSLDPRLCGDVFSID